MKWKLPRLRKSFKFGSKSKKEKDKQGDTKSGNGEKVTSLDEMGDSSKRLCDRNHRNGISNNPEDTCLISPGWDCEKCHDEKPYLEEHHHYYAEHHNSQLWSPTSANQQFLSSNGPSSCASRVTSREGDFVGVDSGKMVVDSRVHFEMMSELQQMRILCSSLQSYLKTPTFSQDASTQTCSDSTTTSTTASNLPECSRTTESSQPPPFCSSSSSSSVFITINDKSVEEQKTIITTTKTTTINTPQSTIQPSDGKLPPALVSKGNKDSSFSSSASLAPQST